MKIFGKTFGIIIVLAVALFASRGAIAKFAFTKSAHAITGLELNVKDLRVDIVFSSLAVNNLNIMNPKRFSDQRMVYFPEISVHYDLKALLGGKIHLQNLRLNLEELVVVRNADGELNLDVLKKFINKGGKPPQFQIDTLDLKIGKVVYKDYTQKPAPFVKEYNVNLSEHYKNIDNPKKLVSLLIVRSLTKTSIAELTSFNVKELSKDLEGLARNTLGTMASDAINSTANTLKNIWPFKN